MARGNTLAVFLPQNREGPDSGYATRELRGSHPVLAFDPDTDESAIFAGILPRIYDGSGITAYLHFAAVPTSGNVRWQVAFERIGDEHQDLDADGFAAYQTNLYAVPGTSGHVKIAWVSFSDGAQMDSVLKGEGYRIKITRYAEDGSDTADGDAQLRFVELKET